MQYINNLRSGVEGKVTVGQVFDQGKFDRSIDLIGCKELSMYVFAVRV